MRSRRALRVVWAVILALAAVVGLLLLTALLLVRGSLPRLDGSVRVEGLGAPATISRDALGVVDIVAADRLDVARGLGFAHAQDRFFQMDLQRRSAAGELAALVGRAALPMDRDHRRHRFRVRSRDLLAGLDARDRDLLDAYADGVNQGLEDLRVRPFEYLFFRQQPQSWRPEDTLLTLYAMFLDLSLSTAESERNWALLRDTLPAGLVDYLMPRANRWEAPLQEGGPEIAEVPDSSVVDLRTWTFGGQSYDDFDLEAYQETAGSNCWAVAGSLSAHGGALLANDMHLAHGLPNIWYRARLRWGGEHDLIGVTLPGTPLLVAGSNGHVAWGFTNSYGDWVDLVLLEESEGRYRAPSGEHPIERVREVIEVARAEADTLWIEQTVWGPVWGETLKGIRYALRWTAHDAEAANLRLWDLEGARDVDEAVRIAATAGIPPQNFICADSAGRIAWTVTGSIPAREGWDGSLPVSWADGAHRWDGYRPATEQPKIVDPLEGRLWTANNRVAAGADLEVLGDGGYALGARARQIRDGLRELDRADESDMLALQLDDRAPLQDEWRRLMLRILARHEDRWNDRQAKFHRLVSDGWEGRASANSARYRLVRNVSSRAVELVYGLVTTMVRGYGGTLNLSYLRHPRAIAWQLLTEAPPHLLPPWYESWDEPVLRAVDLAMEDFEARGGTVEDYAWDSQRPVRVAHPFAGIVPALARWLEAPSAALPGDSFMPRVQQRGFGASERLVVSPGREGEGIFHMPGGQSGHPLSPYFLAGHEAWVEGRATPLLPGSLAHRLELVPGG